LLNLPIKGIFLLIKPINIPGGAPNRGIYYIYVSRWGTLSKHIRLPPNMHVFCNYSFICDESFRSHLHVTAVYVYLKTLSTDKVYSATRFLYIYINMKEKKILYMIKIKMQLQLRISMPWLLILRLSFLRI